MVSVIYTGEHYDAIAISPGPRAKESEDTTEFNPRTKRGKMVLAAVQKLVELTHRGSPKFRKKLKCTDCNTQLKNQGEANKHALATAPELAPGLQLKDLARKFCSPPLMDSL
eukprot:gene14394-20396_t